MFRSFNISCVALVALGISAGAIPPGEAQAQLFKSLKPTPVSVHYQRLVALTCDAIQCQAEITPPPQNFRIIIQQVSCVVIGPVGSEVSGGALQIRTGDLKTLSFSQFLYPSYSATSGRHTLNQDTNVFFPHGRRAVIAVTLTDRAEEPLQAQCNLLGIVESLGG